jgi:glycosyltransferase involved in cell wall biosynthesis
VARQQGQLTDEERAHGIEIARGRKGRQSGEQRRFAGRGIGDGELRALYAYAQALVFPSTYEGFGLPPLEAMAEGCPVVAADAGALPEVCGPAALYVDPHSADSIAEGMRRVLRDRALRARLVAAGRERAAGLGWDDAAKRMLDEIQLAARLPRREPLIDPALINAVAQGLGQRPA